MFRDNEVSFLWGVIAWPLQFIVHVLGGLRDVLVVSIPIIGKVVQILLSIMTSILLFFYENFEQGYNEIIEKKHGIHYI